jgi:glutamate dehydrogenase
MRGLTDLGFQNRLMYRLENAGMLDRALELLPSDAEIAERRERRLPLTRPELAVLLAYSKISLYFELIKSPVVDDPYLSRVLADYFPKTMRERFAEDIEKHALRREIIATMLSNAIINRGGSTFIVRLAEETGRNEGDIAHGFAATMGVFRVVDFYRAVDELDNRIDGVVQLHLYMRIQDLIRYQTAWFLRHGKLSEGLSGIIERYRAGVDKLFAAVDTLFDEWLHGRLDDMQNDLVLQDVPEDLAWRFTYLGALSAAPEIITLAIKLDRPEVELGRVYFSAASHFRLEEVRVASETLAQTDYHTRLAVNSTVEAIASAQRAIVEKIYASAPEGGEPDFIAWCREHDKEVTRARKSFDDILDGSELTLAKLTIAVAHLRELAER